MKSNDIENPLLSPGAPIPARRRTNRLSQHTMELSHLISWQEGEEKHDLVRSKRWMLQQGFWTPWQFLGYGAWTLYAIALMLALGWGYVFPDGANPSCDAAGKNSSFCEVLSVFNGGNDALKFLSGFVLAGFVASSRSLWLTRRTAYCALCGSTRNLLINICSLAPVEDQPLLARWALLGYELSVLKARSLMDSDEGKAFLTATGLIVGDEWETMVNGDRHTTAWYWIQATAKNIKDEGRIDSHELQTLCQAVTLSRDKANDLMSHIDRDQPAPYIYVVQLLVQLNLFYTSTTVGLHWATWMNDAGGFAVFTEPRMWAYILIVYLYTMIYAMLFDVCGLMFNPFGPRKFDIQHYGVGEGIRRLGMALSDPSKKRAAFDVENGSNVPVDWAQNSSVKSAAERLMQGLGSKAGTDPGINLFS